MDIDNNDVDEDEFNEDLVWDEEYGWVEVDNSREFFTGMSKEQIIAFFDNNEIYKAL